MPKTVKTQPGSNLVTQQANFAYECSVACFISECDAQRG